MKGKSFLKWAILLPVVVFLLLGCSGKGKGIKTIQGDPEILYKQGLVRFNKRDYPEALKRFEELKSNFPDSPPYTVWAEMKIGDCHFLREEYVEAIAAYEEFKKIHPTHGEMPYVQYQIGMAYFNQMLTLDRDQTSTMKALSNFEYLIANYPPSLFTERAKKKIGICRQRLADHEFYIGNFYYKNGRFQAAASRFEGLLERFPKMSEEDKTLFLLGKSYIELDQWDKAEMTFMKIVTEYSKSSYYKEAKAFLDQSAKEEKKISLQKEKEKELEKKGNPGDSKLDSIPLVKFEEEGKQPISLSAPSLRPKAESIIEVKPEEEKRIALVSDPPPVRKEEEGKPEKEVPREPKRIQDVDTTQPINITSDRVESYSKENLIVFKGNVIARQKDIVIYADSVEAVTIEGDKGIERVTAVGNVKIQQGPRVANCQKAVFYNLDQKVVLTGDPKVIEGENAVSGDEIIFDIEKNQFEVKGGPAGRGKARIIPGEEFEKKK
jgi:outer membrane protein assembly factor BamD